MIHYITVDEVFRLAGEQHRMTWLCGREGGERRLTSETLAKATAAAVGHFNLVHPNRIQVLGTSELEYLDGLDPPFRQKTIEGLFSPELLAVVVAGGCTAPASLIEIAERTSTPLFSSAESSAALVQVLGHIVTQALAPSTLLHGVFLEVQGLGVLIAGDPSVGKSELALELVSRGHRLISDDVVEVYAVAPDTLEGRCPRLLQDFMEVRGLGVLNVRRLFGETAVKHKKNVKFIIHLTPAAEWQSVDRLEMQAEERQILGVMIPEVRIPVAVGRNLAVLVEVAVRNHILRQRGYNSSEEFAARQRVMIDTQADAS